MPFHVESFWVIFISTLLSACQCCDRTAFRQCVAPMQAYASKMQTGFSEEKEFREICRELESVSECVKPVLAGCPERVLHIWQGLDEAFTFMCGADGMRTYLSNLDCLIGDGLKREMHICNESLTRGAAELVYTPDDSPMKMQRQQAQYCSLMNHFVDCMAMAVYYTCGEGAAAWHGKILSKLLEPLFGTIHCTLGGSSVNGASTQFIGIALVLALFISFQ